ncbi:hypothetical protein [Pleionea sp. CnH1-48]|uniref:hypothetical protein n=1 Tax=Pleionea sp. CnH1-48 TaxID=2954494 RepID=UPI002097A003|nr:hypothetical protein [Pleionea sp. CnH1-48]MCO7223136.1 hypothetical protein [Pleionea sp. CnH1-48]
MKPYELKFSNKHNHPKRAKSLLESRLKWLSGFPVTADHQEWWFCPHQGELEQPLADIDRNVLAATQRAINTLKGEYPEALQRLVGDIDEWEQRLSLLLEDIKACVHQSMAPGEFPEHWHDIFSASQVRRIQEINNHCRNGSEYASALAWWAMTDPDSADDLIQCYNDIAPYLHIFTGADITIGFQLWLLYKDLGKRIQPLLDLLDPEQDILSLKVAGGVEFIAFYKDFANRDASYPQEPPFKYAQFVYLLIKTLVASSRSSQKKILMLLNALQLNKLTDEWQLWWQNVEQKIVPLNERLLQEHLEGMEQERVLHVLNGFIKRCPDNLYPKPLMDAILHIVEQDQAFVRTTIRCMESADRPCCPLSPLLMLISVFQLSQWSPKNTAKYLPLLAEHFEHCQRSEDFYLWRHSGHSDHYATVDYQLINELNNYALIESFFDCLRRINQLRGPVWETISRWFLMELLQTGYSAQQVAELVAYALAHKKENIHFFRGELYVIKQLYDNDCQRFYQLKDKLDELAIEETQPLWEEVIEHFASKKQLSFLTDTILSNDSNLLFDAIEWFALTRNLNAEAKLPLLREVEVEQSHDHEHLPPRIRCKVEEILTLDAAAKRNIYSLLNKHYPDKTAIVREARAIDERLKSLSDQDGAHLKKRRESLERRLKEDAKVSPQRLNILLIKLDKLKQHKLIEALKKDIHEQFFTTLRQQFSDDFIAHWENRYDVLKLIASLGKLSRSCQKLAIELLERRLTEQPWDLRDLPQNQTFLHRMTEKGLNTDYWLNGNELYEYQTDEGEFIRLKIEQDPLEVFNMGSYFNTCLSPGAMNFFSVFANAADVNKQVIFARGSNNRVIGRVLIALNKEGGLLNYFYYSHHAKYDFMLHANEFIDQIAQKLNTIRVDHGQVECLQASHWYDDGPAQIDLQFPALIAESDFRRDILTVELVHFEALINNALAPWGLTELTLPLIVSLPELEQRPELVQVLARVMAQTAHLPRDTYIKMIRLALQAQCMSSVYRLLSRSVEKIIIQELEYGQYHSDDLLLPFTRQMPQKMLNFLRKTRHRKVKSMEEEPQIRRHIAAVAYHSMGRLKSAEKLMS